MLPPWLFKILSTAIRLLNNVVGGVSFVRHLRASCALKCNTSCMAYTAEQAVMCMCAGNSGEDAESTGVVPQQCSAY